MPTDPGAAEPSPVDAAMAALFRRSVDSIRQIATDSASLDYAAEHGTVGEFIAAKHDELFNRPNPAGEKDDKRSDPDPGGTAGR